MTNSRALSDASWDAKIAQDGLWFEDAKSVIELCPNAPLVIQGVPGVTERFPELRRFMSRMDKLRELQREFLTDQITMEEYEERKKQLGNGS